MTGPTTPLAYLQPSDSGPAEDAVQIGAADRALGLGHLGALVVDHEIAIVFALVFVLIYVLVSLLFLVIKF